MVGGIYTVLSTRAATLTARHGDKLIFIGPDVWIGKENPYFEEAENPCPGWDEFTQENYGLSIRAGRWKIPGKPLAVLVDFMPLMARKNEIYARMWEDFGVDSLPAYGDYDEASMFGYASGVVVESYFRYFHLKTSQHIVAHFNEWTSSFGAFYVTKNLPFAATLFTTHATSIGRSIAGNNKPLYNYLPEYDGDQMAQELNMVSKHSTEKAAAHVVDCFTTVSDITARECAQLLKKQPDIVTPNGFENDFVPKKTLFPGKRKEARAVLRKVAETLLGYTVAEDALFVATAGRYEYKNKGVDIFIESLKLISEHPGTKKEVVAFVMIPAYIAGMRNDLASALNNPATKLYSWNRFTTHELHDYYHDNVMNAMQWFHFTNMRHEKVKIIFVPSYLNGKDGIFNKTYYELLIGMDLTVFPSYYEPWGYTPLESIAFSVPTITTDLSGFGQWALPLSHSIETGVAVIHRSDYNNSEVAANIGESIRTFAALPGKEREAIRAKAAVIAEEALWKHFIAYYEKAYSIALNKAKERNKK
jgi:glycosyltransferase involved in cell wall biosynthesis